MVRPPSMSKISSNQIVAWIERYAAHIAEQKDYLTQLDAAIGDADHGANMHRGFQAVLAKKADLQNQRHRRAFQSGRDDVDLYGRRRKRRALWNLLLASQHHGRQRNELSPSEFGSILEKGLAGIVLRGKAAIGDKTMVDALQPAIKAYKRSVESGEAVDQALANAVTAAEEGLKSTMPLVARKGRASYLGERSAGHPDPGATSTVLLFRSAAETLG